MQHEVAVIIDGAAAEALSNALLEAGALSVALEDADAAGADEAPLYGEPGLEPDRQAWPLNRLVFMVNSGVDANRMLALASDSAGCPTPRIDSVRSVGDADWVRLTQSQFPPVRISERLWIVPTWHEPPDPTAINIRLDPGVAFGTGTHPTTRLCLNWLAQADLANTCVLDYGCGSGILAIAAKKLGARQVDGTDIDAQALDAARRNSALNGADARFVAPEDLGAARYDVVLANILANPLKVLAPTLIGQLADAGTIVLSGILDRQAQDVIDWYEREDDALQLSLWNGEDGWSCIVANRLAQNA
jgi:ribosomal protein L11 methyltransferase